MIESPNMVCKRERSGSRQGEAIAKGRPKGYNWGSEGLLREIGTLLHSEQGKHPFNASMSDKKQRMDGLPQDAHDSTQSAVAGGDYKSQHALSPGHLACWEM